MHSLLNVIHTYVFIAQGVVCSLSVHYVFCTLVMTSWRGIAYYVTDNLCGHWWIPLKTASNANLWCFQCCCSTRCRWFETPYVTSLQWVNADWCLVFCVVACCAWYDMYGVLQLHAWWRHQMEIFSALLALCEGNPLWQSQWRTALVFSLMHIWTNSWRDNGVKIQHYKISRTYKWDPVVVVGFLHKEPVNAESVSVPWRHHERSSTITITS